MEGLFNMGKKLFKDKMNNNKDGSGGKDEEHGTDDNQRDDETNSGNDISSRSNILSKLKAFDRDGDGKITENDFILAVNQVGLGKIGESGARSVFKRLDTNHNGQLDVNEALNAFSMIKKLLSSKK